MQNVARRLKITVSADRKGLMSQAGALLLAEAARVTGLSEGLSAGLARWRAPRAGADPHRLRRRHPRVPHLAGRPPPALLDRHDHRRGHAAGHPHPPGAGLEPAYDAGGQVRPGAWVAELTGLLDLFGWPDGMRVIVRRERPHSAPSCGSPTWTAPVHPHERISMLVGCHCGDRRYAETWRPRWST